MRLRRASLSVLIACLLAAAGCARWHATALEATAPLRPRDKLEIWAGGRGTQLHGLRITPDSITGVPYLRDPRCDSCRVGYARADVDSVRVLGNGIHGFGWWALVIAGSYVVLLLLFCGIEGGCPAGGT